jgi:hypothetical protein
MTEWAIPFWIFIGLLLILPLALLIWMTLDRRRNRAHKTTRGFEVKMIEKERD